VEPSVGTAIVLEEVAAIGGKHLNIDHSSNNRYYLSWDDLGVVSDIDILARVRVAGTGPSIIQLIARAYTSSEETGYAISADSDDERFLIKRYFGGTGIDIATAYDYAFVVDTWHMIRFRLEGTAIKFRVWADGGEEPEVWHKDITDVRIINGFCGIGSYRENDADCDWISIATAGGIAPGPPIGWTGKINGVSSPAKINGIAVANIHSINGVE